MYERFTDRARKVMQLANQEAQRFNHEYIGTEHILLGLIQEGSGVGANVLKHLALDLQKLRLEVQKIIQPGPYSVTMGKLPQTPRTKKVVEYSIEEARNLNHNYVGTEHLLLGLLREQEGVAAQVLMNLGLKLEDVREEVLNLLGPSAPEAAIGGKPTREQVPSQTPTLDRLSDDLTEQARQGKLDPVVGRGDELRRLLCILHRRSRNSSIVVGGVGVGKTALVAGLAQLLAENRLPEPLSGWRLVRLDLTRMLAGTRHHGHFEERLREILNEIHRAGRVILVLDDLHLWTRMPRVLCHLALGRDPAVPWIATATPAGYEHLRDCVESLVAFFQPLTLRPLSPEQAGEALRQLRGRYESHHRVTIQNDALQAVLELTADPTAGVRLDRALSVLDEAAADAGLSAGPLPELRELDERIDRVNRQKEEAVAEQDFPLAARLCEQVHRLQRQKEELTRQWHEQTGQVPGVVDRGAVLRIVRQSPPSSVQPDHITPAPTDTDPKPPSDLA